VEDTETEESDMKTIRDVTVILGVALLTLAPAGLFLAPRSLGAQDVPLQNPYGTNLGSLVQLGAPTPLAPLTIGDVTLSATPACAEFEAGAKAVLTVTAANRSDEKRTTKATVRLWSVRPGSPGARRLPMPEVIWTGNVELTLGPKGKKEVLLAPDCELPAAGSVRVEILSGEQTSSVANFTVKAPAPKTDEKG
jgi:hypothetical protein